MSTPNGIYFCHNCGRINPNQTLCPHCQSEFLEQNPNQQISLIEQFQNLFNNDINIQNFTNMLLPMLMSQIQSEPLPHRHRRTRSARRIKRVTHIHTPVSQIRLFNINRQRLDTQLIIFDPEIFRQLIDDDRDRLPRPRTDLQQLPTLTSK